MNHMENHTRVSSLIGEPENVGAAECTRRINAKIGHALFHSLFQRDDIVGRSLYRRDFTHKKPNKQTTCLMKKQGLRCYVKETIHHNAITKQFSSVIIVILLFIVKSLSAVSMRLGFLWHTFKLTSLLLKSIGRKI